MSLFAISDLHLSFKYGKTMDMFGKKWFDHPFKIKENWEKTVHKDDTIIISGDVSWAMNLPDAIPDLEFIHNLPGKKIIHEGNHDYWTCGINRLNSLFDDIYFLKNDYYPYGDYGICAARGWVCPNEVDFTEHDNKIYKRETGRLKTSLERAKKAGCGQIIISMHFPPVNDKGEETGFSRLARDYGAIKLIYGHLHGQGPVPTNILGDTSCSLVSCDYLNFSPLKLL